MQGDLPLETFRAIAAKIGDGGAVETHDTISQQNF
jgi:hypothetical protein